MTGQRDGFEGLVAEVALGQVGIILALEASRLARDNAAWYRLLDLAGVCDTLVADADGVYHPAMFNDRLVLGMKGIHRPKLSSTCCGPGWKAASRTRPPAASCAAACPSAWSGARPTGRSASTPTRRSPASSRAVFEQFAVCGSARATWLWLRGQGLRWPLQKVAYTRRGTGIPEITWVEPAYHAVHTTLTHPAYAGAYVYGRTRKERYLDRSSALRQRSRRLPRDQWEVLIPDHHPGFIDWDTYQANQARIGTNIRPQASQPGTGAVREGSALLQGLATCGACGRKLAIFYTGPAKCVPELLLPGIGRAGRRPRRPAHEHRRAGHRRRRRRRVPGRAGSPPRWTHACKPLASSKTATTPPWPSTSARSSRPATTPAGPSGATAPSTRTTGWSPAAWKPNGNSALRELADAEAELARRETARPRTLTAG